MKTLILSAFTLLLTLGCSTSHEHISDMDGIKDIRGKEVEYQITKTYSINILGAWQIWGDSSKPTTLREFTGEATARGAERMRVVETDTNVWWWIFPPFSIFIQPVTTTVEGEIEGTLD